MCGAVCMLNEADYNLCTNRMPLCIIVIPSIHSHTYSHLNHLDHPSMTPYPPNVLIVSLNGICQEMQVPFFCLQTAKSMADQSVALQWLKV